jgi:hypothetical protein
LYVRSKGVRGRGVYIMFFEKNVEA